MSELVKRTLSGAVYVAVVVGTIVWLPDFFCTLVALLCFGALHEYYSLMKATRLTSVLGSLAGGFVMTYAMDSLMLGRVVVAYWDLAIYLIMIIILLVSELFWKAEDPIRNWGIILTGQMMIALPFSLMNYVMASSQWLMLAVFVLIWVNDSGAYLVGSTLSHRPGGNHKMFPRVSPGKSWEGLVGGILLTLVAGYIFSVYVADYSWWQWLLLALGISVAATLGDLTESLFKRTLGVKDSGRFMPGHGGVLDRFDSLLLATPVVFILLLLIA